MGGLRAAVGVVLGVISLAVLSLHIALCIHYPSPLFAVTLLLNPSLWLFLGLIGMGCALLLTHRDQQRKVRAGHCVTCHPHYGATSDKGRSQETKWRGGAPPCQRGPSRAIYSYNGNLHKFYASYGTINENQVIEMKRSVIKSPPTSSLNDNDQQFSLGENDNAINEQNGNADQNDDCKSNGVENCRNDDNNQSKDGRKIIANNACLSVQREGRASVFDKGNMSNSADSNEKGIASNEEKQNMQQGNSQKAINSSKRSGGKVCANASMYSAQEMSYIERKYCDCLARYGAVYHYPQPPRSTLSPRSNRYDTHDRALTRYERKLLMRCKLKPPNDVPVELFAAKETPKNANSKTSKKAEIESDATKTSDKSQSSNLGKSDVGNSSPSMPQRSTYVSEEDMSSAGCTDTTSLSSMAEHSSHKDSVNQSPYKIASSDFIAPLKHMSRYSAQTSTCTSLPLGSPYNGKSKHMDHLEDHESTSMSSDHTTSEKDLQDQDVVSISSKSSLLPSSPEKSSSNKDLTRSPIWRPFKSSLIGRKRLSDDEKSSNEDFSKTKETTNDDNQESLPSSFKSVFTNKRSFSKSGAESRYVAAHYQSNENLSSGSSSSSASPAMKEKRCQQPEATRSPKSKSSFSRKISAAKSQSLQKNSKNLLLSPAKAVRSLVFKNAQRKTSRMRKVAEDKLQQNDSAPSKLPLLSSPAAEGNTYDSNVLPPAKSVSMGNSAKDLAKEDGPGTNNSSAEASVSPSHIASSAASVLCSTSAVPKPSSPAAQASICSNASVTEPSSKTSSTKKPLSSGYTKGTSSHASEANEATPFISSSVPSSSPSSAAAVSQSPAKTVASSNTPSSSPSVRPKEPKKPKIRLKGKHRSRMPESAHLLTADSDE